MTKPDIRTAIVDLANGKAEPGQPVDLLDIGPTLLLEMGFDQDEVVNALYAMQSDGVIRVLEGNRIAVIPQAQKS